jgi:hypothetical protein
LIPLAERTRFSQVVGGARSGAWLSVEARAAISNASLPVLAKAFHALNAAGKTPMWSSGRTSRRR